MSDTTYTWNRELVAYRRIGNECVLIPIAREAGNLNAFFPLNESAALIWDGAAGGKTCQEITEDLLTAFDVDEATAIHDTEQLLRQLIELKAISPNPGS